MGTKHGSAIWSSFCKNKSFILSNFRWKLFTETNAYIGRDLIMDGLNEHFQPDLTMYLHYRGIFTWEKLIGSWNNATPVWHEAADLHLPAHLRPLWESARSSLSVLPINRAEHKDFLAWKLPRAPLKSGTFMLLSHSYQLRQLNRFTLLHYGKQYAQQR